MFWRGVGIFLLVLGLWGEVSLFAGVEENECFSAPPQKKTRTESTNALISSVSLKPIKEVRSFFEKNFPEILQDFSETSKLKSYILNQFSYQKEDCKKIRKEKKIRYQTTFERVLCFFKQKKSEEILNNYLLPPLIISAYFKQDTKHVKNLFLHLKQPEEEAHSIYWQKIHNRIYDFLWLIPKQPSFPVHRFKENDLNNLKDFWKNFLILPESMPYKFEEHLFEYEKNLKGRSSHMIETKRNEVLVEAYQESPYALEFIDDVFLKKDSLPLIDPKVFLDDADCS